MMSRSFFRLCLLALFALAACADEVTRTQLTFSITATSSVRSSIDSLRVTVRSDGKGDQTASFGKAELNWPVEIVVVPEGGNRSTDTITLLVSAFGEDNALLANQTVSAPFQPERVREVPVSLGGEPVNPGETDGGKDDEEEVDAGSRPQPKPDSGTPPPPDNCSTKPEKIKCDDGNPCNGKERCNPASSNALPNGCVPSDSPVSCGLDMTCDVATGECSTCVKKPDGDGDGVNSIACGGLDCDDNDPAVAPKKSEKCNNRDDDCDGTRDGSKADADCASAAPKGGSASCVSGMCVGTCKDKSHQIINGVCAPPPVTCPIANPCAPGACVGGSPTYSCMCPVGFRAGVGMTRCAPVGVPLRTVGFEATCDGMALAGTFTAEQKPIAGNLYAACGIASITSGSLMTAVQVIKPTLTPVDGVTKDQALVVTPGMSTATLVANSELAIAFAPPVTEVGFDILDIDNFPGLTVTLRAGATVVKGVTVPTPTVGSKRVRFKHAEAKVPFDQVTITYTPLTFLDGLYIDELSYRVGGCGDNVVEGDEACDDGNAVQCDGCDNACGTSSKGCLSGAICVASGAVTGDGCGLCSPTATPDAGGDLPLSKNPSAPSSCAP
ncbi:MAG TPA: MopE-related protein [Polyangiales bacterium]